MAIVPSLGVDEVHPDYQHVLARPINLFRALANSPEGTHKFHAFAEWIRWECALDPRLRELLILLVGYLTADEYEWSHHLQLSQQFGVTDADVRGLMDHADGRPTTLGETEQLVLTATAQITMDLRMDDDVVSRITAAFSPQEVTEIVMIAAFYSMVVRVLGGLRIEVEPDYLQYLERFPLNRTSSTPGSTTIKRGEKTGR